VRKIAGFLCRNCIIWTGLGQWEWRSRGIERQHHLFGQ